MKRLLSPHYLGFYCCIIAGTIAVTDATIVQMLAINVSILMSNLIGVNQGWYDAMKWMKEHE